MKIEKRMKVGIPLMIIMSPVILAGFIFRPIKLYFDAGMEIADEVGGAITSHMSKWEK